MQVSIKNYPACKKIRQRESKPKENKDSRYSEIRLIRMGSKITLLNIFLNTSRKEENFNEEVASLKTNQMEILE